MLKDVKSVSIVGGGTSAWFAAAFYTRNVPNVSVTLIDKELGQPVGVGEGTLLYFENFMKRCGFTTPEWFNEVDAVFKAGILFPRWGGQNNIVWHPFSLDKVYNRPNVQSSLYEAWTHLQKEFPFQELSALYNESINYNSVSVGNIDSYAMHIDASKIVQFLQKKLKDKITVIKSEVVDITRDENSYIKSVTCLDGTVVESDVYIDCTGFKQLLQDNPDRVDLKGRLFVDTAVAGHVPYIDKQSELKPYVTSQAVDHGWVWEIPVQSRIGSGLVFNRSITSIDEAKEYFCNYWDNRIKPEDLKVIDWTPYYSKNQWDKNVIAIGLSAGFIEPLESTGLGTIIGQVYESARILQCGFYTQEDINLYNAIQTCVFEDCIDFVSMHYANSDWDTKFWNFVNKEIIISERHKYFASFLQQGEKLTRDGRGWFFGGANWNCWLCQIEKDIIPNKYIDRNTAMDIINEWEYKRSANPFVSHIDAINDYKDYVNITLEVKEEK